MLRNKISFKGIDDEFKFVVCSSVIIINIYIYIARSWPESPNFLKSVKSHETP
uniref:Uncharacterized protein n=1 Tax=Helianthus annuus TaxID=4232 RepID=A0A251VKQ6_HELAN